MFEAVRPRGLSKHKKRSLAPAYAGATRRHTAGGHLVWHRPGPLAHPAPDPVNPDGRWLPPQWRPRHQRGRPSREQSRRGRLTRSRKQTRRRGLSQHGTPPCIALHTCHRPQHRQRGLPARGARWTSANVQGWTAAYGAVSVSPRGASPPLHRVAVIRPLRCAIDQTYKLPAAPPRSKRARALPCVTGGSSRARNTRPRPPQVASMREVSARLGSECQRQTVRSSGVFEGVLSAAVRALRVRPRR